MDIMQNIRDGKYKTKLPYPTKELYPDKKERNDKRADYRADVSRLEHDVFKQDLFTKYGLTEHPKREKLWNMAWGRGHSAGMHEVAQEFDELADLVTTEVIVLLENDPGNLGTVTRVMHVYDEDSAKLAQEEEKRLDDQNKHVRYGRPHYECQTFRIK